MLVIPLILLSEKYIRLFDCIRRAGVIFAHRFSEGRH